MTLRAKDRNHRVPIFFVRILRQAGGGLSRKAPSNARGDDPPLSMTKTAPLLPSYSRANHLASILIE